MRNEFKLYIYCTAAPFPHEKGSMRMVYGGIKRQSELTPMIRPSFRLATNKVI